MLKKRKVVNLVYSEVYTNIVQFNSLITKTSIKIQIATSYCEIENIYFRFDEIFIFTFQNFVVINFKLSMFLNNFV